MSYLLKLAWVWQIKAPLGTSFDHVMETVYI